MRQMNDELLSIQGVSQIGARHCSCSNNAHFCYTVVDFTQEIYTGDLRLLRTFSIRPLINYGRNTKMSLSSDFSEHQGDIIFSVLGGKLQKSLLQFSYPVMNNESTRVTEDSSTL